MTAWTSAKRQRVVGTDHVFRRHAVFVLLDDQVEGKMRLADGESRALILTRSGGGSAWIVTPLARLAMVASHSFVELISFLLRRYGSVELPRQFRVPSGSDCVLLSAMSAKASVRPALLEIGDRAQHSGLGVQLRQCRLIHRAAYSLMHLPCGASFSRILGKLAASALRSI